MIKTYFTLFIAALVSNVGISLGDSDDECECGTTRHDDLIAKGKNVRNLKRFPFIVTLHRVGIVERWGFCSGAIISPTFILTAAHCLEKYPTELYMRLFSGQDMTPKHYLSPKEIKIGILGYKTYTRPSSYAKVAKIIPHPNYNFTTNKNDIGLIKLSKPIECTDFARPICISNKQIGNIGDQIFIAGFGEYEDRDIKTPRCLKMGEMRTVNSNRCDYAADPENVLCAIGGEQSSCQGDSGSAAFVKRNGRYFAVGITYLESVQLCTVGMPVSFMKVICFYDFIKHHVHDLPSVEDE